MKVIVRPRRGGKTTMIGDELIRDPSAVCVVPDWGWAHGLARRLDSVYGRNASQAQLITVNDLRSTSGRRTAGRRVFVDDLDAVLMRLLGNDVDLATVSGEVDFRRVPASAPGPLVIL